MTTRPWIRRLFARPSLPSCRGRPVDFSTMGLRIFFGIPVLECPRRACLQDEAVRRDG
jgi:hypothetical protein